MPLRNSVSLRSTATVTRNLEFNVRETARVLSTRLHRIAFAFAMSELEPAPVANWRYKFRPAGSTWGDFGKDDELGRLNLVTSQKVLEGIQEVKEGKTFCLSLPLDRPKGLKFAFRPPPVLSPTYIGDKPFFNAPACLMGMPENAIDTVCDDRVLLTLQYSTQWDTLAHVGARFDPNGDGKLLTCYCGWRCKWLPRTR